MTTREEDHLKDIRALQELLLSQKSVYAFLWRKYNKEMAALHIRTMNEQIAKQKKNNKKKEKAKTSEYEIVQCLRTAQKDAQYKHEIAVGWLGDIAIPAQIVNGNTEDPYKLAISLYFGVKFYSGKKDALIGEKKFLGILENAEAAAQFVNDNKILLPYIRLLYAFDSLYFEIEPNILNSSNDIWARTKEIEIDSFAKLEDAYSIAKSLYICRKKITRFAKEIYDILREAEERGTAIPALDQMQKLSPVALCRFLSEHGKEFREHFAAYVEQVAPGFDAQATLDLLRRIEPRPQEEDFVLLSNEIAEIDAGSLNIKDSDLLNIILPAVQGEKAFDIFTDGLQLRQRYSIPFALQLHQGAFRLGDACAEDQEAGTPAVAASDAAPAAESVAAEPRAPKADSADQVEEEEQSDPFDDPSQDAPNDNAGSAGSEEADVPVADAADAAPGEDVSPAATEEPDAPVADTGDAAPVGDVDPADSEEPDVPVACAAASMDEASPADEEDLVAPVAEAAGVAPEEDMEPVAEADPDGAVAAGDESGARIEPAGSGEPDIAAAEAVSEEIPDSAAGEGGTQAEVAAPSASPVAGPGQDEAAEAADGETTPLPDLAQVTASLIDNGKTAAVHWLSEKTETGLPVWLTELLHLGLHLRPHFTEASYRTNQLLNDALGQYSNLTERQSLLFVAAILRPMLFLPQTSYMPVLSHLAGRHKTYSPFLVELRKFVGLSKPLDERFITQESAQNQRARELEALLEETRDFWQRMRKVRLCFRPASDVHRALFNPKGYFGQYLDACLNRDFDCLDEVLDKDWTFAAKQELVDNVNSQISKMQRTKSIVASARTGLFADIDQTLALLARWRTYARTRDLPQDSASHLDILKAIRPVELASTPEERLLQSCLAELKRSADEKTSLCTETMDPAVELALWPLALPFDLAAAEPGSVLRAVAGLLESGKGLDHADKEAVARHMMRGELVLTEAYLQAYKPTCKLPDTFARHWLVALAAEYGQKLDIGENRIDLETLYTFEKSWWRKYLEARRDSCLQKISEAYFRGSILFAQQAFYRDKCLSITENHREANTPLLGLRALEQIEQELVAKDAQQELILENRLDELRQQAEQDGDLSLQRRIADIAGRIVRQEKRYSDAYLAISDIEQQEQDSGSRLAVSGDSARDILAHSKDFYARLKEESESGSAPFVCQDPDIKSSWVSAQSALRRNTSLNARDRGIVTKLVRHLGFSLERDEAIQDISTEGSPCFWRVLRCGATITSPLPQWGSRADGQHTFILGWSVTPERLQQKLSNSLGNGLINRQQAITILCFTPLSYADRIKFLSCCRALNLSALLVDTNLYYWLSSQDDRIGALFGVTLAGSVCNPYTPNVAGAVPSEMFFGRENFISELKKPDGPCIVYGGRQLGKTALLQQIAGQKDPDLLVCQFTMPAMTLTLLDVLSNELQKCGLKNVNRKNLEQSIDAWLEEHPSGRILVLADECDQVLEADCEKGCEQVRRLSTIMQNTGRRFKIVLTGLHSVQRFNHVSNVPLIHYGSAICVGPLSPNEAYDLLVEPLNWLGLDFEDKSLALMAINHCNYHPKVIQMLGEELLRAVMAQQSRREPLFTITRQMLISVLNSREVQKKIVECFEITLNLDERYLVIGYVMALLLLQEDYASDSLRSGAQLTTLYEDLCERWPAAFRDEGNLAVLASLLEEMEGLGLLVAIGGSYRLRTPNIINLLGGEDTIKAKLEAYRDKPYEPRPNLDEWRVQHAEALVASQYNRIAEKKNGLVCIVGSRALGLEDVPAALQSIAREQALGRCIQLKGTTDKELRASLKKSWDTHEGDLLVWASSTDCAYMPSFLLEAAEWLKGRRTAKRIVRIVCLLDPSAYFELCDQEQDTRLMDYPDVTCLYLHPWTAVGLETWYRLYKLDGNPPQDIGSLMAQSGGWHALLFPLLQGRPAVAADSYFARKDVCFPERPEVLRLLKLFQDYGDLTIEDCQNEFEDLDPEFVKRMIRILLELHVLESGDPANSATALRLAFGLAEGLHRR